MYLCIDISQIENNQTVCIRVLCTWSSATLFSVHLLTVKQYWLWNLKECSLQALLVQNTHACENGKVNKKTGAYTALIASITSTGKCNASKYCFSYQDLWPGLKKPSLLPILKQRETTILNIQCVGTCSYTYQVFTRFYTNSLPSWLSTVEESSSQVRQIFLGVDCIRCVPTWVCGGG